MPIMAEVGDSISTQTGAALGSFIANDYHITGNHFAAGNGRNGLFFGIIALGRAFVLHHLRCNSALLHHSAVFCQVAGQHSDTAVCRERCLQGVNNLTVGVRRSVQSILYRAADGQAIGIDHTALGQLFHHCGNTAHIVQIRNKHGGGRIQLADLGVFLP